MFTSSYFVKTFYQKKITCFKTNLHDDLFEMWINLYGCPGIQEQSVFVIFCRCLIFFSLSLISCLLNTGFKIFWLPGTMISLATERNFRVGVFLFPATNDLMKNLSDKLKALEACSVVQLMVLACKFRISNFPCWWLFLWNHCLCQYAGVILASAYWDDGLEASSRLREQLRVQIFVQCGTHLACDISLTNFKGWTQTRPPKGCSVAIQFYQFFHRILRYIFSAFKIVMCPCA